MNKEISEENGVERAQQRETTPSAPTASDDDEESAISSVLTEKRRGKDLNTASLMMRKKNWRLTYVQGFLTSLFEIDYTHITFVPALRTSLIMCIEMSLMGIGSNQSTAFRLGALFVGLTDPNGSLSLRLRFMGATLLTTTFFGTVLPALTWQSSPGLLVSSFLVALLTGLSPGIKFGNDASSTKALVLSMTLGMALFAINQGINKATNGYGGLGFCVFWTVAGGLSSLVFAILPELVGDRDAVRSDLFQMWNGFGESLRYSGKQWGTVEHLFTRSDPVPRVTACISENEVRIHNDSTETAVAKKWLETIIRGADQIRVASLCFSNVYDNKELCESCDDEAGSVNGEKDVDSFYLSVGRVSRRLAFALQFPWIVRYIPLLRRRINKAVATVDEKIVTLLDGNWNECGNLEWLPCILRLIQTEVHSVSSTIMDGKTWPPYSPVTTIFQRTIGSLPSTLPSFNGGPAIRVHALRLAFAFTLATIPIVAIEDSINAHWFPMTVAFIMVPGQGRTYKKIDHRMFGTLLGLLFGTAISPLFDYTPALIVLLGLTTYAAILLFSANYCLFTFFITGWVLVTVVGAGGSSLGLTSLYRSGWTLAAGLLVFVLMFISPSTSTDSVSQQLSSMAEATGLFAEAVLEESCVRRQHNGADELAAASSRVDESRRSAIKTRIAMLTAIHDAALASSKGCRIDPHTVAPCLAADLLSAVVIPQCIFLVKDGSADSLLLDFSPHTFAEIDRISRRLVSTEPLFTEPMASAVSGGNGPLSDAIARAHHRLDEAGIPPCC